MKFPSIHYVNRQVSKCPNCTLRCLFRILLQVIQTFFGERIAGPRLSRVCSREPHGQAEARKSQQVDSKKAGIADRIPASSSEMAPLCVSSGRQRGRDPSMSVAQDEGDSKEKTDCFVRTARSILRHCQGQG